MMLLFCKCRRNLFHRAIKGNQSCCRLFGSVKDVTYCKNLLNKANEEMHATAEARGGGYSICLWVERCGAAPHTLTLFKTNIANFPTLFKTEFRFFNTLFKTF